MSSTSSLGLNRHRKSTWFFHNVLAPKQVKLAKEVGLIVHRHWDGLYFDFDPLEEEVQDTIEAVQQQFCREGKIWQGQRYQGNFSSTTDNTHIKARIIRGGSFPQQKSTYVKKKDRH